MTLRIQQFSCAALIAFAAAAPLAAADEPKIETQVIEKRIVHSDEATTGDRSGRHHEHAMADCNGDLTAVESDVGTDAAHKNVAKIAVCTSGGKAKAAEGLERALANLTKSDDMNAATKADLTAKLKARIAELRAGS
jgi:hypothetical protein